MTPEAPPVSLVQLVRRNRRRYGGYIVHFGVAIALVGVAASTSFQHQRRAVLSPGQSVSSDGYTYTYVRPVASASSQDLGFGALIRVTRSGHLVKLLRTTMYVYPSQTSAAPIGRFFDTSQGASVESRVGLDAGLTHDLWVVISANTAPLNPIITRGDAKFSQAIAEISKLPASQRTFDLNQVFQLRDRLVTELTSRWVSHPWKTQFLIENSPLVTWLWLGGIIAAIGGLIALWPVPRRPRRDLDAGDRHGSESRRRAREASAPGPRELVGDRAGELVTRMEHPWPAT